MIYNKGMVARKSFGRRVVRKQKKALQWDEGRNIIEKEFVDSRGNKIKFRFDFNPHPISEPTIKWQRDYGDD